MNKPSKTTLWIIIAIFALVITYLFVYVFVNDIDDLRLQAKENQETIENLEDLVERKDFAWAVADMEIDNLEQIIKSKNELILELKVKEEVLGHAKEMLEYSLTYIHFMQKVMEKNGLTYPEFIIESILEDDFLENRVENIE